MEAWKQIATGALVGTDRQPFVLPHADGELGHALARISVDASPRGLLTAAALAGSYTQAGRSLAVSPAETAPAQPDTLRPPSGAVERLLFDLLGDGTNPPMRETLGEFLELAASLGLAIPHRALPRILDAGARDRSLRAPLLPVIDSRGRWLASRNKEWSFAAGGADESKVWEEGSSALRVAFLSDLRASDPAGARELLEVGWKKESAQDRQAFLALFEVGLSNADEPFLDGALDDRGKEVRRLAADLLSRLPESAFSRRAVARAESALRIESKLLRKRLAVTPPEALDDAAKRDGLEADDPGLSELGEKAKALYATLAVAPLEHWEAALAQPPEALIELSGKTDWELALLAGWSAAARRQRNKKWISALLRNTTSKTRGMGDRELLAALGAPGVEADALRLAEGGGDWDQLRVRLDLLKAPWSEPLTAAAEESLWSTILGKSEPRYARLQDLTLLGRRGHPSAYPNAARWAEEAAEKIPELVHMTGKFLEVYAFRHSMHKEMRS